VVVEHTYTFEGDNTMLVGTLVECETRDVCWCGLCRETTPRGEAIPPPSSWLMECRRRVDIRSLSQLLTLEQTVMVSGWTVREANELRLVTVKSPLLMAFLSVLYARHRPSLEAEGTRLGIKKRREYSVDKKNQLDVTFCILYFSSNSCSKCFGQPCAHHQELTTA
jgi:hypothetical protein